MQTPAQVSIRVYPDGEASLVCTLTDGSTVEVALTVSAHDLQEALWRFEQRPRSTSLVVHSGRVALTEFVGPAVLGPERRCLQVGDDVQLTPSDAVKLARELVAWAIGGGR